jgi:chemotaxis protein CheD
MSGLRSTGSHGDLRFAMPLTISVGISDCQVTTDSEVVLVTYALGSCIAVSAFDPVTKVGGLLHIMLPDSSLDTERGRDNPYMYADTAIPLMLSELTRRGASKQRLVIRLAGGAQVLDDNGIFNIGTKNHVSTRRALSKAGVFVRAEAIGGSVSRTVWLEIATGRFLVREGGGLPQQLVP